MCRNIKTLFNFDPPATEEEIRAASVQFVRKLSGFTVPSKANQAAFDRAVDDVSEVARRLIDSLVTTAAHRNRDEVAARGRDRAAPDRCPQSEERYRVDARQGTTAPCVMSCCLVDRCLTNLQGQESHQIKQVLVKFVTIS